MMLPSSSQKYSQMYPRACKSWETNQCHIFFPIFFLIVKHSSPTESALELLHAQNHALHFTIELTLNDHSCGSRLKRSAIFKTAMWGLCCAVYDFQQWKCRHSAQLPWLSSMLHDWVLFGKGWILSATERTLHFHWQNSYTCSIHIPSLHGHFHHSPWSGDKVGKYLSTVYSIFGYWDMTERNFSAWLGEQGLSLIKRLTPSSFSLYCSFPIVSGLNCSNCSLLALYVLLPTRGCVHVSSHLHDGTNEFAPGYL